MERVKPVAIKFVVIGNLFASNGVKTAQIDSWWHEEIATIDPAQRKTDSPHVYTLVVNETSYRLFSLLTLFIRLLQ